MALSSIFGTEHEYGIFAPDVKKSGENYYMASRQVSYDIVRLGADVIGGSNRQGSLPISMESLLREYGWDAKDFIGGRDVADALRYIGGSGYMLWNGARFYVDAGHPEYSTPECSTAYELLVAEKAGERIVEAAGKKAEGLMGRRIYLHKDNSDRHGHSYAAHENYLVTPKLFDLLARAEASGIFNAWINFLVTRQIWAGAGKAGSDFGDEAIFQLSQRAEFFSRISSLNTMQYRGIVNTRDNSYADDSSHKRLHVILGDANMCDVAIFLKVGVTALFLKMLEDDFFAEHKTFLTEPLRSPLEVLHDISVDAEMRKKFLLRNEKRIGALEAQEEVLRLIKEYGGQNLSLLNDTERKVAEHFEEVIIRLRRDPSSLYGWLDHITKRAIIARQLNRLGKDAGDPLAVRLDFLYHDINRSAGLFYKLCDAGQIVQVAQEIDVIRAMTEPPETTRAWLRSQILKKFHGSYGRWNFLNVKISDGWQGLVLDNPSAGSRQMCEKLLEKSRTAEDFFKLWKEEK
ncbi:MAG: proteasome accessory factor PafA2 family protein [Candidatus Niyogibacteria bacterium]|nr:proteasome accessory factor PafA2 family protein [Candidatus Niyogibacteria bacterium]